MFLYSIPIARRMSLQSYDYTVRIRVPIYPTERVELVKNCLERLFPGADWQMENGVLSGETQSLDTFARISEDMKIRDTLRDHLLSRVKGDGCTFGISKQAACNSKINLSILDQPLGHAEVDIRCDKIEMLIAELTKQGYRE